MRKPHLLRSFEIYGRHRCIAEFIVYHRIIAEIDYHGMEAVLKPRMKVSKSRSTGR